MGYGLMDKQIEKRLNKEGVIAVHIGRGGKITEFTCDDLSKSIPKRGSLYTRLCGMNGIKGIICL